SKREPVKNEPLKKELPKREPLKNESLKKELPKREPLKNESLKKELPKREPVKKELPKREPVKNEPLKKELPKREPVKNEPLKKELPKREPLKKEAPKREPLKKENPKREPQKREPLKKETPQIQPIKKEIIKAESQKFKPKKKSGKVGYILLACFMVCFLGGSAVVFAVKSKVQLPNVPTAPAITMSDNSNQNHSFSGNNSLEEEGEKEFLLEGVEYPKITESERKEGVYTFLIIGRDTISGSTDTMILVTYDTVNQTLDGMSILRDTIVNINATTPKLNAVYNYARGSDPDTQAQKGTDALKLQISKLTGIYPDFYVMIEWEAVGELVDVIGGVEFEVPYDMKYDDPLQNLHIDQAAGLRVVNGDDAMEIIRHRQNNIGMSVGDSGRVEVQQDFLIAVAQTCLTPDMLWKAPELANIFFSKVQTDLSVGNLLAFAQLAMGMNLEEDVQMVSMPYYSTNRWLNVSYVAVAETAMLELINESFNPYLEDVRSSDLQLMYSNGNGTFGVTNAALANPAMAVPPVYEVEEDEEETDEEETDGEETDEEETDGEEADGEETDGEETDGEETDGEETDGEETDEAETDEAEADEAEADEAEVDGVEVDGAEVATDGETVANPDEIPQIDLLGPVDGIENLEATTVDPIVTEDIF
ncbi:MAG: LCP family protein, partial [Bacillota bacterium]